MQTGAHGNSMDLGTVLSAAMEAAAGRIGEQARCGILAARLATAVHMRPMAESEAAQGAYGQVALCVTTVSGSVLGPGSSAAPAQVAGAAEVMRRGAGAQPRPDSALLRRGKPAVPRGGVA